MFVKSDDTLLISEALAGSENAYSLLTSKYWDRIYRFLRKRVNDKDVKHGWLKTKQASLFFKNPNFKVEELNEIQRIKDECIKEVKLYAPKYHAIETRTAALPKEA